MKQTAMTINMVNNHYNNKSGQPRQKIQEIRLLINDEEVLDEADEILGDELARLNRRSRYCHTPTEIAKVFGMSGADLNSFLCDRKIIYKNCGQWKLTRKYQNMDLTDTFYKYKHDRNGRRRLVSSLVWTNDGRQFLMDIICGKRLS